MKSFLLMTVAAISLACPTGASAAELLFDVTGVVTASFIVDPAVTPNINTQYSFGYRPVTVLYNGTSLTSQAQFASLPYGGFTLFTNTSALNQSGYLIQTLGGQLFTGTLTAPTFVLGSFSYSNATYLTNDGSLALGSINLRVSEVSSAVPEPVTWAMMLIGFGFIGGAMRLHRKQKLTVSYA